MDSSLDTTPRFKREYKQVKQPINLSDKHKDKIRSIYMRDREQFRGLTVNEAVAHVREKSKRVIDNRLEKDKRRAAVIRSLKKEPKEVKLLKKKPSLAERGLTRLITREVDITPVDIPKVLSFADAARTVVDHSLSRPLFASKPRIGNLRNMLNNKLNHVKQYTPPPLLSKLPDISEVNKHQDKLLARAKRQSVKKRLQGVNSWWEKYLKPELQALFWDETKVVEASDNFRRASATVSEATELLVSHFPQLYEVVTNLPTEFTINHQIPLIERVFESVSSNPISTLILASILLYFVYNAYGTKIAVGLLGVIVVISGVPQLVKDCLQRLVSGFPSTPTEVEKAEINLQYDFGSNIFRSTVDQFVSHFVGPDKVFSDNTFYFTWLGTSLAMVILGKCCDSKTGFSVTEAVKLTSSKYKMAQTFIEWIISYIVACLEQIGLLEKEASCPKLDKLLKDIQAFRDDFLHDSEYTIERYEFLRSSVVSLEKAYLHLLDVARDKDKASAVLYILNQVKTIQAQFEQQGITHIRTRVVCPAICFIGEAGVGKSTLAKTLSYEIAASVLSSKKLERFATNPESEMHYIHSEDKYTATGFMGQAIMVYDDMLQFPGIKGTPNPEIVSFFRIVGCHPYALIGAAIADKGQHYVDPELVIASTNLLYWRDDSLINMEAFSRRWTSKVMILPKKEWCTRETRDLPNYSDRRIDEARVREDCEHDLTTYKYHEVIEWDPLSGQPVKGAQPVDAAIYVKEIIEKIQNVKRNNVEATRSFSDFARKVANERLRREGLPELPTRVIVEQPKDCYIRRLFADFIQRTSGYSTELLNSFSLYLDSSEIVTSVVSCSADPIYVLFGKFLRKQTMELLDSCNVYINKLWSTLTSATVLTTVITLGSFVSIVKLIATFFTTTTQSGETQRNARKMRRIRALKRKQEQQQKTVEEAEVPLSLQSDYPPHITQVLNKIVRKNMFALSITGDDRVLGICTLYKGRCAFMPHHFYDGFVRKYESNPSLCIVFTSFAAPSISHKVYFKDITYEFVDEIGGVDMEECIFFKVPPHFPMAPDISNHLSNFTECPTKGDLTDRMRCLILSPQLNTRAGYDVSEVSAIYSNKPIDADYLNIPEYFYYQWPNRRGVCGSLLFSFSQNHPLKILGMHVAGNGYTGYSIPIFGDYAVQFSNEMSTSEEFDSVTIVPTSTHLQMVEEVCRDIPPHFEIVGDVERYRLPSESKIVPSKIHGRIARPVKWPVDITSKEAYRVNRSKYNKNNAPYSAELLRVAGNNYWYTIRKHSHSDADIPKEPVPFKEVIRGWLDLPGVNRKSSAGPPYNRTTTGGKRQFFGSDGDYTFDSPEAVKFLEQLERDRDLLQTGVVPETLVQDLLKDECRSIRDLDYSERPLDIKDPRLFFNVSMRINILVLSYFAPVLVYMKRNRINNGSGLGINPYSHEWHQVAKYLEHTYYYDGDYKAFDASLSYAVLREAIWQLTRFFPNEQDNKIRMALFESIVTAIHIAEVEDNGRRKNIAYQWRSSNLSGWALTTLVNIFANHILIRYAMYSIRLEELSLSPFQHDAIVSINTRAMEKDFKIIAFGDDIIMGSNQIWLTHEKLAKSLSELGMTYTDSSKGCDIVPVKAFIEELSFLQRGFRRERGIYVAPLKLEIIFESLNWTRESVPETEFFHTIDWALGELSLHGCDVFSAHSRRVLTLCRVEFPDYVPRCDSYNEWLFWIQTQEAFHC